MNEYSKDYHKCTEEASQELKENARPELKKYLQDIADYENIFACGPCWWGTYPVAVFTQLERLDFTGKKVMALMTHEGSLKLIAKAQEYGEIKMLVNGGGVSPSQAPIEAIIRGINVSYVFLTRKKTG